MIKKTINPDGWITTPLESLIVYFIGGDWGKAPETPINYFESVYCIRGAEFRHWNTEKGKTASLRIVKQSSLVNRKLIENDILVEISGGGPEQPVGRTVIIDKSCLSFKPDIPKISTNFLRLIRPSIYIDSRYLNYYLKFFYASGEIVNYQAGSNNLRNLKFKDYMGINIPIPPGNEQHHIVSKIEELFSELDKGIESLKTAREQLKVYRQALLKHAFEGKLTEQWRKDNADKLETADQLLEGIKQEREDRYHQQLEDWKEAVEQWESKGKKRKKPTRPSRYKYENNEADQITTSNSVSTNWKRILLKEIILDGPTNGYSPKSGNDAKGTQSLKLTATTSCKMILNENTIKKLYEVIADGSKHWLEPNDLLVQRANAIKYLGSTAIYSGEQKKYIYPDLMMRLRFNSISLTKYVWFYLNGHEARMYFQNNATGIAGSMPQISGAILRSTPISLPPINEIKQITELLDNNLYSISLTENELKNQIKKSESLRHSILKKAFSGKLVPQDPNDEPASELLKRIAQEKAELEAQEKAAKAATKKTKPKSKRKK